MDLKKELKDKAESLHIDLLGFAGPDRFAELAAEHNPFSIFPEAKTVIMLGLRILRGLIRGMDEGTDITSYGSFGYSMPDNQFAPQAAYDLVCYIEDRGWEACPVFPNPTSTGGWGISVAPGRPAPNVTPDFEYAAVACGLGEIGRCGAVLTPELGHRQRFQMILTDAELESDPLLSPSLCTGCGTCAKACPVGAIEPEVTLTRSVYGQIYPLYTIRDDLCKTCRNGGLANRLHPSGTPDRYAAACMRACAAQLERRTSGGVSRPFAGIRPWARDRKGYPVQPKE